MFLSRKDISLLVVFIFASRYVSVLESASVEEKPSVVVVILVRNEEHTLPIFLNLFEKINYPKDKLSLFIRSDHNVDGTNEIIDSWLSEHVHKYESINVELTEQPKVYNDEKDGESFWSSERRMQLIHIREEGLEEARKNDADFVWFLDADAFLRDPHVLQKLILEDKIVVAPMLTSVTSYANFWGDMSESFWYKRSDDYLAIQKYENKGCFPVSLVYKCVLINLNHEDSEVLSFQPSSLSMFKYYQKVPVFDYTILALNARGNHINIYVCNKEQYGNILDSNDREDPINVEILQISQLAMEHISKWNSEDTENTELNVSTDDTTSTPSKQNLSFDKVYFINLARRPEKEERMEKLLRSFGLNATWFKAVDSLNLNATFLEKMGMKKLNTYKHLTFGEVGCFLSHYALWEEIVAEKYKQICIAFCLSLLIVLYFAVSIPRVMPRHDRGSTPPRCLMTPVAVAALFFFFITDSDLARENCQRAKLKKENFSDVYKLILNNTGLLSTSVESLLNAALQTFPEFDIKNVKDHFLRVDGLVPKELQRQYANKQWHRHPLPVVTSKMAGRFGNWIGAYASLIAVQKFYNTTVFMHPNLKTIFISIFPHHTLKELPSTYGDWIDIKDDWSDTRKVTDFHLAASGLLGPRLFRGNPFDLHLFNVIRQDLLKEFRFSTKYVKKATDFLRSVETKEGRTNITFISFHIRQTDYVRHFKEDYGGTVPGQSYFEKALSYYRSKYRFPIFIAASDDREFLTSSLGTETDVHFVPDVDAMTTLVLLSSCNHSIITTGSFGFWSGFLTGGQVVRPNIPVSTPYMFSQKGFDRFNASYFHVIS